MNLDELDGVPVLWEQAPPPFTAALVFNVGARHESFRTVGLTHLVEHLAMGTLGKSALDRNAEVDLMTTTFHATGPEGGVVDFIHRVCAAISDPPLDRVPKEVGVLDAEGGTPVHPALGAALLWRYGHQAQGLAGSSGPGHAQLTAEQVRAHIRGHFTRGNAALVLTGPPPAGLRLSLPEGERVQLPVADPVGWLRPGWAHHDTPALVLSGLVTEPAVGGMFSTLLRERAEDDLRHGQGISYEIDTNSAPIRPGESLVSLHADTHKENWDAVAEGLWSAVDGLAGAGPTPTELDHARAVATATLTDPRAVEGWLHFQAARMLVGLTPRSREEQLRLDLSVDVDDVRRAAGQMRDTALVLTPEHLESFAGLSELTPDDIVDPEISPDVTYRRKGLSLAPRDLAFGVSESGFLLVAKKQRLAATWESVVGLAVADDLRGLLLVDGRMAPVPAAAFKDGDRLVADLDRRLGHLRFMAEADDIWS